MDSIFNGRLSFLNAKVEKIDELIKAEDYKTALPVIEEVLEWAPRCGELYWKKVLAIQRCKDDVELLHKGGVLQNITAFINAREFTDKDKSVYTLIADVEKNDGIIKACLKKTLEDKEREEKQNTGAKDQLLEFQEALNQETKAAQENIKGLEFIEKSIHEQVIACAAISEEYKYALEAAYSTAAKIKHDLENRDRMTLEEKADDEFQVDIILAEYETAVSFLKQLKSDHPAFLEYSKLKDRQQSIKDEIKKNESVINDIQSRINGLLYSLNGISDKYDRARIAVSDGSYDLAKFLLSQGCVEGIINQALMPAKTAKPIE